MGRSETQWLGWQSLANEYLNSALRLHEHQEDQSILDEPTTFLYHHCAELLLKMYLTASLYDATKLQKIGHNIQTLAEVSIESGLSLSPDSQEFLSAIPIAGGQVETRYYEERFTRRMKQELVRGRAVALFVETVRQSHAKSGFPIPTGQENRLQGLWLKYVDK